MALRLRDWHISICESLEILNDFNTLTLKQAFWKTKTYFKNLEYHFLDESTVIENAAFAYKTSMLRNKNVKTNRIESAK